MDLMPTEWRGYSSRRARPKEQHELIEARCTLLRDEACTLSRHPEIAPELEALALALQHLGHILNAQASEHLTLCSQLYLTYETEYDDYVIKHYSTSNINDERLFDKLKRARKSFLTSHAGLTPCERWPDFYQVGEAENAPREADAWAPPEPIQPEPIMGSTLSVDMFDVLTDNRSEALETSLMPEHETGVKRSSAPSFPAKADPLQPLSREMAPIVVQEVHVECPRQAEPHQQSVTYVGALVALIPSSLAQESLLNKHKNTYPRKRPKELNKALVDQPREPLLSQSIKTRSLAPLGTGSIFRSRPSPSASPQSDRAKQLSPVKVKRVRQESRRAHFIPGQPPRCLTLCLPIPLRHRPPFFP
jgi:hypothetical protein